MKMKSTCKRGGFTLIEMLVVIAIIAILAGLLFPAVTKAMKTAKRNKAKVEAKSIAASINIFFNDYGYYPVALASMGQADITADTTASQAIVQTLLGIDQGANASHALNTRRKIYLSAENVDNNGALLDPWGNQYIIILDTNLDNQVLYNANTYRSKVVVYSTGGVPANKAEWVSSVD